MYVLLVMCPRLKACAVELGACRWLLTVASCSSLTDTKMFEELTPSNGQRQLGVQRRYALPMRNLDHPWDWSMCRPIDPIHQPPQLMGK